MKNNTIYYLLFILTGLLSCSDEMSIDDELIPEEKEEEFSFIGTWDPVKAAVVYDNGKTDLLKFTDGCDTFYDYCITLVINDDGTAVDTELVRGMRFVLNYNYEIIDDVINLCIVGEDTCFYGEPNEKNQLIVESRHSNNRYYSLATYEKAD